MGVLNRPRRQRRQDRICVVRREPGLPPLSVHPRLNVLGRELRELDSAETGLDVKADELLIPVVGRTGDCVAHGWEPVVEELTHRLITDRRPPAVIDAAQRDPQLASNLVPGSAVKRLTSALRTPVAGHAPAEADGG